MVNNKLNNVLEFNSDVADWNGVNSRDNSFNLAMVAEPLIGVVVDISY